MTAWVAIFSGNTAPLKITKKEILKELEKISVNEANRKMEENIETFMKQFL